MSGSVLKSGYGGGMARSSVLLTIVNTEAPSTSGRKCAAVVRPDLRADRIIQGLDAAKVAARLLSAAFPAPSANATCEAAAQARVCSYQTARRILLCETAHASWKVIGRLAIHCMARGVDPLAVAGVADLYRQFLQGGA